MKESRNRDKERRSLWNHAPSEAAPAITGTRPGTTPF